MSRRKRSKKRIYSQQVYKHEKNISQKSVKKIKFYISRQVTDLNLVDVNKIVISDKLKHTDDGFKYFTGYNQDDIIKSLYTNFPQMS